jgi:uncharacterized delta-60 repeat protein
MKLHTSSSVKTSVVLAVLLLAGSSAWAQCTSSGCLDTTFGLSGNGLVTTNTSGTTWARALLVQTDGKLVAAGIATDPVTLKQNVAAARYDVNVTGEVDGTLDITFGGTGVVVTSLSSGADFGNAAAIDSLGRIVLAGYANLGSINGGGSAVRYNPDGSLDTSFNHTGIVTITCVSGKSSCAPTFNAVVVQSWDNRILLGGQSSTGSFTLTRLNTDGTLDTSFGTNGTVNTSFGRSSGSDILSLMIQSDERIVAVGDAAGTFALARYNTNGTLDTTFGTGGLVTSTFSNSRSSSGKSVAIDTAGNIVVAGIISYKNVPQNFGVVRYLPSGHLDSTFGSGGMVTTDFANGNDDAFAVAIQSNGEIVVAGNAAVGAATDFGVCRYNANGSLDSSFGNGGKVVTNFGGNTAYAYGLVIQLDGKIVAAGLAKTTPTGGDDFGLARYLP